MAVVRRDGYTVYFLAVCVEKGGQIVVGEGVLEEAGIATWG